MTDELGGETLMTSAQVATLFHVTDRTVRNWVRAGILAPVRIGGRVYFHRADIEVMLVTATR